MSRSPIVSVIVPAYNAEAFLADCLESVSRQSMSSFEVIVVDDGSTDNTIAIAQSMAEKDSRFHIVTQANAGVGSARNVGISKATGRFVAFLDADDMLFPNALRQLLHVAETTGAPIVLGNMVKTFDPSTMQPPKKSHLKVRCLDAIESIQLTLYQHIVGATVCGALFRRELFDNLAFATSHRYEDLDISYRLMHRAGQIALVNADVYIYRQHRQSFIHMPSRQRVDSLDVTDRIVKYVEKHCPEALDAALSRRFAAHCNVYGMLSKASTELSPAECEAVMQRCWQVISGRRSAELLNRRVRMRNRIGALLAFCPPLFRYFLSHW